MLQTTATHVSAIDDEANLYLARLRQIDKIMEGPVKTLIGLTQRQENRDSKKGLKNEVYFPTWITSELTPQKEDNRLTQAICCGTLQEIWRFRRRFSWLDKTSTEQLKAVRKHLVKPFTPKESGNFSQCATLLSSEIFGGLNPLTASHIFRVLLDEGEASAHSGIGFLAFFAMIWPLSRTFPVRLTAGARIEPWDVTAYVTAKCLLPIRRLQGIIERRAKLYDDIAGNLSKLHDKKDGGNPQASWQFRIELDDLCANLSHLSRYAIDVDAFADAAKSIRKFSDENQNDKDVYKEVLRTLSKALNTIKTRSRIVLTDAKKIVKSLGTTIVKPLRDKEREFERQKVDRSVAEESKRVDSLSFVTKRLALRFADEHAGNKEYWKDLAEAAEKSIEYCEAALTELDVARNIRPHASRKNGSTGTTLDEAITSALGELSKANRRVKKVLNKPVQNAALWCRNVVDREIAHASAENFTDFDPSELVSGIAVAVAWDLMSTTLQVSDAVTKAIVGARKDGSWRSGKPYYSRDHATGIWATTSDIVWTLTRAIEEFPTVTEADQELFKFVDWLERTQISLTARSTDLATQSGAKPNTAEQQPPEQVLENYVGWPSERLRDRGKIQPGTTALSINALMEIRNLVEYRLWELCKKRFTVLSINKPLRDIAPVDLGATHPRRLHRQLEWMAYKARMNDEDAAYSVVLHGPPGSSKTKLAEALSAEMWKYSSKWGPNETRLIRITPADFTRLGEDRLDSEARAIFDLLTGVRAVTIFFDEIDDLLRQRNTDLRPSFMQLVVPAMLNRLADLRSACPRQEICFILATNYVDNIDSALIRKGRIDASIPVVYPDFDSRVAISIGETEKNLKKDESKERAWRENVRKLPEPLAQHKRIAEETKGWPYLAFTSLCDFLVRELIKNNKSNFENILEAGIAEYGFSFSPPPYDGRLRDQSQEFLNEYTHHIISLSKDPAECEEYLENRINKLNIDASLAFKLKKMLNTALIKEGRWQEGSRKQTGTRAKARSGEKSG